MGDWKRMYLLDIAAVLLLLWATMLLAGSGSYHRYSYYAGLRNVVCLAWLLATLRFYVFGWWPASLVGLGIVWLFNPIAPVAMRKWQWQPYDHWTLFFSLAAIVALAMLSYRANVISKKAT